jgi:IQ domain-containing protein H
VFKIDDEFNGRGHAYLNVDNIKAIQALKKKQLEPGMDLIEAIKPILAKQLPRKAIIAMPTLFKSWAEYMASFCRVGGIIEASPTCLSHQMASPSIAFCIEPDGFINIIGSFDRFAAKQYVNAGCFYPQQSLPNMNMMTICKSIGDILYEKGVMGHITVDLVSFPDPTSPNAHPLFWAIDLNCSMTDYAAACYFFDFLMVSILI